MALIELEKLEMDFRLCNDTDSHWTPQRVLQMIVRQPHVDAKPVVRGDWIEEYENEPSFDGLSINRRKYVRCSICARSYYPNIRMRYCPNCGADMRGRESSND